MADAATAPEFPRYGFSATEPGTPVNDSVTGQPVCNSRLFTSQAELDAAGGTAVWKATPAEAAQPPPLRAGTAPPLQRPVPQPEGAGRTDDEDETPDAPHAPRSRR
jgi:hypothetical protein